MHGAVSIIIVADRAIEQMVAKDAVKGIALRCIGSRCGRLHLHAARGLRTAGTDKFAIHLNHAGIATLNRSQLWVIADLRERGLRAIDDIDQEFAGSKNARLTIDEEVAVLSHTMEDLLFRPGKARPSGFPSYAPTLWIE